MSTAAILSHAYELLLWEIYGVGPVLSRACSQTHLLQLFILREYGPCQHTVQSSNLRVLHGHDAQLDALARPLATQLSNVSLDHNSSYG